MIEVPRQTWWSVLFPLGSFVLAGALWYGLFWFDSPLHQPIRDPCSDGVHRANFELNEASAKMVAHDVTQAYEDGVAALTACVRDPNRSGWHHRVAVNDFAAAARALAQWRTVSPAGWRGLDIPPLPER